MGIRSLKSASIFTGTKRSKFWDQSTQLITYGTEWIATATGNPTGTVTVSNIPTTYDYLEIRATLHSDAGSDMRIIVNGDSGNSYTFHQMYMVNSNGTLTGSTPNGPTLNQDWNPANIVSSALDANLMCTVVMQISNSAGKWKTYQARSAWTNAVGQTPMDGYYIIRSGQWQNTDKITSLTFGSNSGDFGLTSISKIDIYGVKI